ncbi:hypothetical protein NC651_015325 [Populus alba x Populus x berolinensis]|nr:hypothetical protein NC651_015325 [Populus alba x Populus x berolinensis]
MNFSLSITHMSANSTHLQQKSPNCTRELHHWKGFERLSGLDSLEVLYLDGNKFDNSILSSLGGLSSLRTLSLDDNQLKGAISVDELNNLTSLRSLAFGGNEIESFKSIHDTGDDLLRLRNMEYLGLNGNRFNDSALSSLKGLSSLKSLDIAYNQLKGSFNVTGNLTFFDS